jgi:DNA modification methylase
VKLLLNKIYNKDADILMKSMPDNFVDLTITSPPYDHLRHYQKKIKLNSKQDIIYNFSFEDTARELFRITKAGGVVVWVVGDATINGSETGNSFKQALFFKEIGFNLHDTMIYLKNGAAFPAGKHKRYSQVFEYMFVFSKGTPKTVNLIKDKPNKLAGSIVHGTNRQKDGTFKKGKKRIVEKLGYRDNIWKIVNLNTNELTKQHPAVFPEQLANDHILTWSKEGELVFDPFCGSGTTLKMAKLNNRFYIGSDISQEYCILSEKRLKLKENKVNRGLWKNSSNISS